MKCEPNQIKKMCRADTFIFTQQIKNSDGTAFIPTSNDELYFALMEPRAPFEAALLYKGLGAGITHDNLGNFTIRLDTADTENLLPGVYYYTIKLRQHPVYISSNAADNSIVTTIVDKTKFIILE